MLLRDYVEALGCVPLGWAGATSTATCLNLGDALSPLLVTMVSGRPVRRVPFKSLTPRVAAIGTIGQAFAGGEVHVWGTGCDRWSNPQDLQGPRLPYACPADTRLHLHATRGPLSEQLLSDRMRPYGRGIYGDPAWLLPRFYRPLVAKRWRLGVILHLSELDADGPLAGPRAEFRRYDLPAEFAASVRLISTRTAIGVESVRQKLDEILACEMIVSTSLHGMVIAEAYGIPCLYFALQGATPGLADLSLDPDEAGDLRIADFYAAFGLRRRLAYVQPRHEASDWAQVMAAVERAWTPLAFDGDRLLEAWPLEARPLSPPAGGSIWQHPLVRDVELQHDIAALRRADRASFQELQQHGRTGAGGPAPSRDSGRES